MFSPSDGDIQPKGRPIINWTLIGICAVVLIYELVLGSLDREIFFDKFGLIPIEMTHGIDYRLVYTPSGILNIHTPLSNWLTLFTSIFIHGDWMHFAGNVLFLFVFGNYVEVRFGHIRYLLFFLIAGVVGSWIQIATNTDSQTPIIGASGAIAGVMGLYLFLLPRSQIGTAIIFVGFWFFLQFAGAVGSLHPSGHGEGIAYWAHVGGFIVGLIVGYIYRNIKLGKSSSGNTGGNQYWRGRPL